MPSIPKRSSPFEVSDENSSKKARTAPKPKKASREIGTCSLTKKEIGDRVKHSLRLEKYSIPRTKFEMQMDTAFFRSFFADDKLSHPLRITPDTFDDTTPVIVVDLNYSEAGELLGVSKVKGGNRMETTFLQSMCFVFRPSMNRCTAWLTV